MSARASSRVPVRMGRLTVWGIQAGGQAKSAAGGEIPQRHVVGPDRALATVTADAGVEVDGDDRAAGPDERGVRLAKVGPTGMIFLVTASRWSGWPRQRPGSSSETRSEDCAVAERDDSALLVNLAIRAAEWQGWPRVLGKSAARTGPWMGSV